MYDRCRAVFPVWLKERGGVVVYQNQMFDSSHFGDTTFLPKKYLDVDGLMHEAADQHFPDSIGMPSLRQQKADHITLEEFDGDLEKALSCFEQDDVKESTVSKTKTRRTFA